MSIRQTSSNQSAQPPQATPQGAFGQPTQSQPQQGQDTAAKLWNWSSNSFARSPISRSPSSELLTRLQVLLAERFKQPGDASNLFEITMFALDNKVDPANFSTLVVCLRSKADLDAGISFHALLLEATGEPIPSRVVQINGSAVEITRTTGDAFNSLLMGMIVTKVHAAFPGIKIFSAGASVIQRTFDIEDKNAVQAIAFNSALACAQELECRKPSHRALNLTMYARDSRMQVELSMSTEPEVNPVGEPIRSDITVNFTSQESHSGNQFELNSGTRTTNISRCGGFVEMIYSPVIGTTNSYVNYHQNDYNGQNALARTQQYAARLVLTSMDALIVPGIPSQLLTLVTAMGATSGGNWMQTLKPTPTSGKINTRNIGVLAVEAMFDHNTNTPGVAVDMGADSYRTEQLSQFITAFIREGIMLALDVPECGYDSWKTSVFSGAANGVQEDIDAIYNSAEILTGGNFSKVFQKGMPMFIDPGSRVHLGYYTNREGVKCDIRDFDYVSVANLSMQSNDLSTLRKWSDSFTQTNWPIEQRLAERKRIITGLVPHWVQTGFAHRVTFSKPFLLALETACVAAGLAITIKNPLGGSMDNQRGVGSFANAGLLTGNTQTVFNNQPLTGNNFGNQGYQAFTGRNWP
jgi:hypothetical protein